MSSMFLIISFVKTGYCDSELGKQIEALFTLQSIQKQGISPLRTMQKSEHWQKKYCLLPQISYSFIQKLKAGNTNAKVGFRCVNRVFDNEKERLLKD